MIKLKISGRLGNQLFQYAAALAQKEKSNDNSPIVIDFKNVYKYHDKENDGFVNSLKSFNVQNYVEGKVEFTPIQKIVFTIFRVNRKVENLLFRKKYNMEEKIKKLERRWQPLFNRFNILFYSFGFYKFPTKKMKKCYMEGYFETSKYFDCIKERLIEEFTPINPPLEKNIELYNEIEKSNSVCVTIRRGDFLSPKYKKRYYVCNQTYFSKAIKQIYNYVDNPRFFVFSDDIEWCKENMNFPPNTLYEDGTDPIWEKLRLMYSCKHFIVSNSSFSWWAQYLSRNDKNKVVIAPDRWWNDSNVNNDIYQEDWILINLGDNNENT